MFIFSNRQKNHFYLEDGISKMENFRLNRILVSCRIFLIKRKKHINTTVYISRIYRKWHTNWNITTKKHPVIVMVIFLDLEWIDSKIHGYDSYHKSTAPI